MSSQEADAKKYLQEIFVLNEEDQLDDILDLRASFVNESLKNPQNYDSRSQVWYVWREQLEGLLPEFWEETSSEKYKDLVEFIDFLESHPYDEFQNFTHRFKIMLSKRSEIRIFDKKDFIHISTRNIFDLFWGNKSDILKVKSKIIYEIGYKSKRRAYANLLKEFKSLFPELYQLEEIFLLSVEKRIKEKSKGKEDGSSGLTIIGAGFLILLLISKACEF